MNEGEGGGHIRANSAQRLQTHQHHNPGSYVHITPVQSTRMNARIEIPEDVVADFCQRHQIRRLALFGSVLRDDFTPESDVDVLVEFEPGAPVGLACITIADEPSEMLGRQVDLHTFRGIASNRNWLLREEILGSAEAVYDQAG